MLEISCARCGRKHFAGEEHLGNQLRCAGCGDTIPIARQDGRYVESSRPLEVRSQAGKRFGDEPFVVDRTARRNVRSSREFVVLLCLTVGFLVYGYWAVARYSKSNAVSRGHAAASAVSDGTGLSTDAPDTEATPPPPPGFKLDTAPSSNSANATEEDPYAAIVTPTADPFAAIAPRPRSPSRARQHPRDGEQALDLEPAKSLSTGTQFMEDRATAGHGELEAINGTSKDACVIVVDAASHLRVRKRYIKAEESLTLDHLDKGEYTVVFATGVDWNDRMEEFNRESSYFEFGKTLDFEETRDLRGVSYVHRSITLHPVPSGNVRARHLTKAQFHELAGRT